jgi:hypothetical protein
MRWLIILLTIGCAAAAAVAQAPPDTLDGGQPVTILSPLPDSAVGPDGPLEISLLLEGFSGLALRLSLDSADITVRVEVTSDYLFCLLDSLPGAGTHRVTLLALSGADTVFARSWGFSIVPRAGAADTGAIFPELGRPAVFPFEAAASLGLQYSSCDQDTAGLGLSTPAGFYPRGDVSISGSAAGGLYNGFLSYDPAYDRSPHGLFQYDAARLRLSLGEFYPELS